MEMTKKEYINKLKKELDTIELRYQHLLNENAMIGEDFRSRAMSNLIYANKLEQEIEELKATIKKHEEAVDSKELQMTVMEREKENCMMQSEEYLTHYDIMRQDRNTLQVNLEE